VSLDLSRRSFFRGLGATLIAAPAIVRAASLMPVRRMIPFEFEHEFVFQVSIPAGSWRAFNQGMPPFASLYPELDLLSETFPK